MSRRPFRWKKARRTIDLVLMDLGSSRSLGKSARVVRTFLFRASMVLCYSVMVAAAHAQLLDSLVLFSHQRPKFIAKLDSRGSFISNSNVRLMGVKVGLEHAGRFQYGVGYTFLASPVEQLRTVNGVAATPVRLRLGYVTPYVEYAFYQRGPWEVRIPVQFGLGGGSLVYDDAEGEKQQLKRAFLFLYEPSMTVQYRFLRYFGVSAGWGFRLVLTNAELDETLSAPIYLFGLKVFLGDLWTDLQPKQHG